MSNVSKSSPPSKRNPGKLPGDSGSESGSRQVGGRHGYQGDGRKIGPGTGKNQGDGAGT